MEDTIFLTQFLGIFLAATGLAMALRRKMMMNVFRDIFRQRGMSFLLGIVMLIVGLFIVLKHNKWSGMQQVAVSVVGWYILLESAFYLLLPTKTFYKMEKAMKSTYMYHFLTIGYFAVGVWMTYIGFFM